jgi:thioredoxin-related protein
MKKIVLIALTASIVFIACSKDDKNEKAENTCPEVAASMVPQIVKDSFAIRYPANTVIIWFDKDNVGYCAYFVVAGIDKLARFSNNGSFIKEELETEQDGQNEDSTVTNGKSTMGCECEIHKEHD